MEEKEEEKTTVVEKIDLNKKFVKHLDADNMWFISNVAELLTILYDFKLYNGVLYAKFDDDYITDTKEIMYRVNQEVKLSKKQFKELMYQLQLYAEKVTEQVHKIKLNNGILTLTDNGYEVIKDDSSFCPYKIDVTYDKKANDENITKFLNDVSCGNKDIYNMLMEMIGSVLLTEPKAQFMFFIYGIKGRNGKSTFTSMLRKFLGEKLTSNVSISGLKDPTSLSTLVGHLLNVCDDADYEKIYLERSQTLKSLASGELINCRPIYSFPIEFYNTATIIGTSNTMPEFADKSGGMRRRLVIIEFNMNITKENNDPNILEKLTNDSAKSTLLNIAIEGMNRLRDNNYFITENNTLKETLDEYYKSTDTVKDFVDNGDIPIENQPVAQVYEAYTTFCEETISKEKESKNVFGMRMKQYGYISKVVPDPQDKKKSIRVYKKVP